MAREDDALARRAAREARRAALASRNGHDDEPEPELEQQEAQTEDGGRSSDALRLVGEAAAAAAAGAVKALAARRRPEESEQPDEPAEEDQEPRDDEPQAAEAPPPRRRPPEPRRARSGAEPGQVEQALRAAREQLRLVKGVEAESVSSLERLPDGWRVTLEVLELSRIPDTTDVLGSYAVEVDDDGNLLSYARTRRYQRSETLEGG